MNTRKWWNQINARKLWREMNARKSWNQMNVLEVGQGGSGHLELRGNEDTVTVSLFTFHCVTLFFTQF